jgi:hypothetical protein
MSCPSKSTQLAEFHNENLNINLGNVHFVVFILYKSDYINLFIWYFTCNLAWWWWFVLQTKRLAVKLYNKVTQKSLMTWSLHLFALPWDAWEMSCARSKSKTSVWQCHLDRRGRLFQLPFSVGLPLPHSPHSFHLNFKWLQRYLTCIEFFGHAIIKYNSYFL